LPFSSALGNANIGIPATTVMRYEKVPHE